MRFYTAGTHTVQQSALKSTLEGFNVGIGGDGNPVALLEQAIALTDHALAYSYLGLYYFKIAAYDQAIATFTRAIEQYKEEPFFYASRCLVYRLIDEDEGAGVEAKAAEY
ncbi:Tetratricopeptide-like helical [Corchorus olitorius]|uniref:Tetratricopeptide-like helical n=1 Tax=Corchorus olitorius TaxID=93759 RepID=A0A1R3L3D1_9ROSI|nr:Tetratricopeptide-like helical [Corchorus olitorius]